MVREAMLRRFVAVLLVGVVVGRAQDALGQRRVARPAVTEVVPPAVEGVPDGYMIIEGDIVVPKDFFERGGVSATFASNLWPGGIVPYVFNANVTAQNQALMLAAMSEWETRANIHFIPRTSQSSYLLIQNSTGNNSFVGRVGGAQTVNIFNWNVKYIMVHELAHALGFWHEQSRPDRGSFVVINSANIQSGAAGNFSLIASAGTFGTYDFDSVMHYDRCAFSTCCPAGSTCNCAASCQTITVLPPNQAWQNLIGQRTHLSAGDGAGMAFLYGSAVCTPTEAPVREAPAIATGRYLTFRDSNPGQRTGIRVTLADLPPPWDAWNGTVMWVGPPRAVSELACCTDSASPSFTSARLQCEPYFDAWDAWGTVYVSHEGVLPGGRYELQAISNSCDYTAEASYSAPMLITNARWGDAVGLFDGGAGGWSPPDGSVDVTSDVIAVLDKFSNKATAPGKARVDLEPATPDQIINITDVVRALGAFSGLAYPFAPGTAPCP